MAALKTKSTPELRGLYSASNKFTQPQGTVPRLTNLYLIRRGAFHTIPGSQWVSSWNGLAPQVTNQLPVPMLKWYSPSSGSSAAVYMAQFPDVASDDFVLGLQLTSGPGVNLIDVSGTTFVTLASQMGAISLVPNAAQFSDYLVVALNNNVPPNIFPTVTQLSADATSGDATIQVVNTLPFANVGYITIGNEIIGYTAKTPTTFTGLTRGAFGTTAAAHLNGVTVFLAGAASNALPTSTTLTAPMLSTDVTADVVDTSAFFAANGPFTAIMIDAEVMLYEGTSPTSFTSLVRGVAGTVAAAHASGAPVFQQPESISPPETGVSAPATSSATTINVTSTAAFLAAGFTTVDAEVVHYTGKTPTSFTGLTRGVAGTVAASHSPGTLNVHQIVTSPASAGGQVWGPITNNFDPSLIYGLWPGTSNASSATEVASVNIGTIIFVEDGAGVQWLFQAQNSGVTAFGATYFQPEWFPLGQIYSDGVMTSGSPTLTSAIGRFTAALVGQPIVVQGAGSGGDLLTTVAAFVSATVLTLANNAGANVSSATYTIGVGHYGDTAKDYNPANKSGTVVWKNIGQASLDPPGAKFVFQHLNALYLWGVGATYGNDGITGPDALWQSDIGSPLVYNPASTTFVGKGDGTSAQGGCEYSLSEAGIAATPQLVLFKDASSYSFLNEFPNPSLVQVSGGLGCIAPGTIQFIGGYGVMRLSYAGVTLFDGQLEHVTEYTDAIRGYLFGGLPDVLPVDFTNIQNCVSTQSVNPPMYVFFAPIQGFAGLVTRMFGYDFGLKQWWVGLLPFAVSSAAFLPQSVVALAANYQSIVGGAQDGAVRRVLAGDADWDGKPIKWSVQLPDWGFPGTPTYVRRVNAMITADGGGAAPSLTPGGQIFRGTRRSGQRFLRPVNTPGTILGSMDVGEIVLSGNLTIMGQGQILLEGSDAQTSDKPTARVGGAVEMPATPPAPVTIEFGLLADLPSPPGPLMFYFATDTNQLFVNNQAGQWVGIS